MTTLKCMSVKTNGMSSIVYLHHHYTVEIKFRWRTFSHVIVFLHIFYHIFTSCYYRVAKRQRIVDILLQIMVESVGFTVSKQFCPVMDGHCLCNCIFYLEFMSPAVLAILMPIMIL